VIINPAMSMKKIILETRQPALAAPLKPKIPAKTDSTKNPTAIIIKRLNIIRYYSLFFKKN
jgi:hypothetical protein